MHSFTSRCDHSSIIKRSAQLLVDSSGFLSVHQRANLNLEQTSLTVAAASATQGQPLGYSSVISLNSNVKQVSVTIICNVEPVNLGMVMSMTDGGTKYPIWNNGNDSYEFSSSEVDITSQTPQWISTLITDGPVARHLYFVNRDTNTSVTIANVFISYSQV